MPGRTAEEYRSLLASLFPTGKAWSREVSSRLSEFLHGVAEEFARAESDVLDLAGDERDTRTASDLLVDHEFDLGLPDDCSDPSALLTVRRQEAHSKLTALGGQDKQYFIDLAAALGFTITITEFTPFWCGVGRSGDSCGDYWVIFYWQVNLTTSGDWVYFLSGVGQSGDPLLYVPLSVSLLCYLNQYKPAHTEIILNIVGPDFDRAFSTAFDSLPAYEASYLIGEFGQGFSVAFDVNLGGAFSKDAFDINFNTPA